MRHFTILAFLLVSILTYSQQHQKGNSNGKQRPAIGNISGKIIDNTTNEAIEFATISIISKKTNKTVNGGITNKHGYFEIKKIKPGIYKIVISFIGFNDFVKDNVKITPKSPIINLGKIELQSNAETLEGVDIVAEKEVYVNKLDKKVFNVDKDITSESASLLETMQNIPSVEIDQDGNVSLRGNTNVKVLIDGRPSSIMGTDLATILEQFPANSVEEIEVITNPSAKYDPDGMAGIINIRLKKDKRKGTNGSILLAAGTNEKYNGSLNLNHRTGKFNLFGTYSFRHNKREYTKNALRQNILSDTSNYLQEYKAGDRIGNSHMINAGVDFYITDKSTISYTGNFNISNRDKTEGAQFNYLSEDKTLQDITLRNTYQPYNRSSFDNNLLFTSRFNKPGQELSTSLTYANSFGKGTGEYSDNYFNGDFTPINDTTFKQSDQNNSTNTNYILQLDYTHPFNGDLKLETGFKSEILDLYNDYSLSNFNFSSNDYVLDSTSVNTFNYLQQIHGVYAILSDKIANFSWQMGLRYEYAQTTFDLTYNNDNYKNTYQNFFPSAHLGYTLGNSSELQLSYSRRINRPSVRSLNPYTNVSDPANIKVGNPYLQPEYINSFELGYSKRFNKLSLITSVYYKLINGVIKRYKAIDDNGNGIITYTNLDSGTNYGLELIGNLKFLKSMNLNASVNMFRTIIEGNDDDNDLSNDALGMSGKLMLNGKLPKKFNLQFSGMYRSPITVPQGTIDAMYWADISIKKTILKDRGSVSLRLSDIFNTQAFNINISDYNFTQEMQYKGNSRALYLSFTYKFGKPFKDSKPKKRKQRRDDGGGDDIGL